MILDEFLSAKDMRAIEANSNYLGVSNRILMENAGKAVSNIIVSRYTLPKTVSVICGLGGNGGDGLVAARHLASQGYQTKVILIGDPSLIHSEETRENYAIISQMKSSIEVLVIKDSSEIVPLNSDIYIDALIGYNFKGPLSPLIRAAVNSINQAKGIKIAIDVPTGIIADTGEASEEHVKADLTVTFHKPKLGFNKNPSNLGEIKVVSVGIPPEAENYVGPGDVLKINKERPLDSHKGMFGRLLVIAGSSQYSGAPILTTMGAYSIGLDLVYTAIPEKIGNIVSSYSPSIIAVKYPQENLTEESIEFLNPIIDKIDAVAIGPGLGLQSETKKAANQIISICEKKKIPMLIDADALKAYGEIRKKVKTPTVFTPHSKEFEILTGKVVEDTPKNRVEIVQKEAKKLGAVILLKGNIDIISDGIKTRLNLTGNPGMTVGGTGDLLSGIVAGYLAQKAEPIEAAAAGAFINGAAGDMIKKEKGYHILPEDLIKVIPTVIENAIYGKI